MALTTTIKYLVNEILAPVGLKLDTLTAERHEIRRLSRLKDAGYFDSPCFPLPEILHGSDPEPVIRSVSRYATRFDDLTDAEKNPVGYSFDNPFFGSPDAEVMYAMVRDSAPDTIVEIGCGHSTRLIRLAVSDGGFDSRIVAIDPNPRTDVVAIADEVHPYSVESLTDFSIFSNLNSDDILSIDSSHELRAGNDILFLYLTIFPQLRPGVIVHIHDVFLPYDYKPEWLIEDNRQYTEQYLVQAILQFGNEFEVLWAGYYLQKTMADFGRHFPHMETGSAQSLWLRKKA